jgi:hypothetical protein
MKALTSEIAAIVNPRTRDEEDQMDEEDESARGARVTDADGGTPTRSRRQPETRATASDDDDDGMPNLRLIRQSGEAAPAGRDWKCYTVCPDYSIVEHPCGSPHPCLDEVLGSK